MRLWAALLLPTAPLSPPPPSTTPLYACLQPLVGGPRFLPVHVVLRLDGTMYDFLPERPTAADTTLSLLSGRSVPGDIRCRTTAAPLDARWRLVGHTRKSSDDIGAFAQSQPSALALVRNDCWTFASALASYALDDAP